MKDSFKGVSRRVKFVEPKGGPKYFVIKHRFIAFRMTALVTLTQPKNN